MTACCFVVVFILFVRVCFIVVVVVVICCCFLHELSIGTRQVSNFIFLKLFNVKNIFFIINYNVW